VKGSHTRSVAVGSILLCVSVLLIRLPLFNYLGYEFSASIALVIPWLTGYYTIAALKLRGSLPQGVDAKVPRTEALRLFWKNVTFLAIPLVVATLNVFSVKNCSYFEGLLFFFVIPFVTCSFSFSLAIFCRAVARRSLLLYYSLLALILLYPVYIGYSSPQIYSYNLVYGYFPGFSYDEVFTLSTTLVLYRTLTLVLSILLLVTSSVIVDRTSSRDNALKKMITFLKTFRFDGRGLAIAFLLFVVIAAYGLREQLGIRTSTGLLHRQLSCHYTTKHFEIFYAQGSFSEEEIRQAAAEHEFRFQQVEEILQTHFVGKIGSYIYPDAETKLRLIGTGTTNIAKPWRKEVHLNKDSWRETLKHELVHVLAGEFGMPLIKAHYNIGLTEGLATAIDNDFGNRTLHEYAAAVLRFGINKNPHALISAIGFMLHSSSVSYVLMGSFCKFLIDRYGIVRFKELYRGESPQAVYGHSFDELVTVWEHVLLRIHVPGDWRRHVEFYFNRPSIFAKECARTVAKLNQDGFRYLSQHNSAMAMTIFSKSLQKSWNSTAFAGLVRSAYQASQFDSVIALMNMQTRDSARAASVVNLFLIYGDALWAKGEIDSAQFMFKHALSFDLSESFDEAAALRLEFMKDRPLRDSVQEYFTGSLPDSELLRRIENIRNHSANPLLPYWESKILARHHEYDKVIEELTPMRSGFSNAIFDAGREQLLGEAYFYTDKFQQAKVHFWQSLNFISNQASLQKVDDWLERCDWYESNAKLKMLN